MQCEMALGLNNRKLEHRKNSLTSIPLYGLIRATIEVASAVGDTLIWIVDPFYIEYSLSFQYLRSIQEIVAYVLDPENQYRGSSWMKETGILSLS